MKVFDLFNDSIRSKEYIDFISNKISIKDTDSSNYFLNLVIYFDTLSRDIGKGLFFSKGNREIYNFLKDQNTITGNWLDGTEYTNIQFTDFNDPINIHEVITKIYLLRKNNIDALIVGRGNEFIKFSKNLSNNNVAKNLVYFDEVNNFAYFSLRSALQYLGAI